MNNSNLKNIIIFKSKGCYDLKTVILLSRMYILKKNIPSNVILQKSNVIKCKLPDNDFRTFYPKIFLSRFDFYTHVYKQLKKIYSYIKKNKNKNIKTIIITHYNEILYS